jgi:hypothetical protein
MTTLSAMRGVGVVVALLGPFGFGACDHAEPSAKANPAADPASPVKSAADPVVVAAGKPYEIQCVGDANGKVPCGTIVVTPDPAAAGASGVVHFSLAPKGVFHVNKDFPISLAITAPDVDLAKPKLAGEDAAKLGTDGAAFDVKYTAKAAGDKAFSAIFRFAVCTERTCVPSVEKLSWTVSVK